jgi:endonuclease/exonuclease/phosphatase family metal-dependent hydrolase
MAAREGGPVAGRAVEGGTIRVAQFNVRGGTWRDREADLRATASCLGDVDLAGIVELRGGGPFGLKRTQAALLAEATGLSAIDAPAERRWWAPQFGNALLTRVPVERWTSEPLPRALGISHRAMLQADAVVAGRHLHVIVAQVDNIDLAEQVAAVERAFRAAPSPAVLLADLSTSGRMEPLLGLVRDPAFVVVTNQPPMPEAGMQGGYVIAKGLKRVGQSFCKGGVSMSPRIAVELGFLP